MSLDLMFVCTSVLLFHPFKKIEVCCKVNFSYFLHLILEFPSPKYYSLNLGQCFKFKNVIEMTTFGEKGVPQ